MSFTADKIADLEGSKTTLHYISLFRKTSKILSILISAIGVLVLFGYIMNISFLIRIIPGTMGMRVNAAVCFVLTGISMFLFQENDDGKPPAKTHKRAGYFLIALIMFFALIPIYESFFSVNLSIDDILLNAVSAHSYTRSMPLNVDLNFILICLALLSLDYETKRGFRPAQAFILIEGAIGMLGFVGYLYGENESFGLAANIKMAFHASIAFLMVSASVLFARPTAGLMLTFISDSFDGLFARVIVPITIIGIIIYGYIALAGETSGLYGASFRLSLTATTAIAVTIFLVYIIARQFHEMELSRLKMSANQSFATFVSHKLFTPLTAIMGLAELFEKGVYGQTNESMNVAAHAIDENAVKMKSLIEELLVLENINIDTPTLQREEIEPEIEVRKVGNLLIERSPAKKIGLSIKSAHKDIKIRMNRKHFDYVIESLVGNAIKFNDKENIEIKCVLLKSPSHLQICITDNGPGMAPEDINNIFRGFYQSEKAFTGNVDGMGIGLFATKKIVEAYGGSIFAATELGQGSSFTVNLPLK